MNLLLLFSLIIYLFVCLFTSDPWICGFCSMFLPCSETQIPMGGFPKEGCLQSIPPCHWNSLQVPEGSDVPSRLALLGSWCSACPQR